MVWKPKEKQLTLEEATALAIKELTRFWFGSKPLIAGVKSGNKVTALPLDPTFTNKSWLMFFIDPTDFSGESVLEYACEWYRRYAPNDLNFLLFLKIPYQFLRTNEAIQQMIRKLQIPFPLALDEEELLFSAFNAKSLPKVILFDRNQYIFEHGGNEWLKGTELKTQQFLRSRDPGLALLQPFQSERPLTEDGFRIDFGKNQKIPATFSGKNFSRSGKWEQEDERIMTADPEAAIKFISPSPRISVIAQSLSKLREMSKLVIEVNGIPAFDSFASENLTMDDDGQSIAKVEDGQLYHVLANLPEENREVTLRFPIANRVPIALYGLRFGK